LTVPPLDWWLSTRFSSIPPLSHAVELADRVSLAALGEPSESRAAPCNLRAICRSGGFHPKRLDRRFAEYSHDALLVPQSDGDFTILVDPIPKAENSLSDDLARHRNRFRIAHEIAHSFFFDRRTRPPARVVSPSAEEELFCDEFASALLVPRARLNGIAPTPENAFQLAQTHDVSVEVAARAIGKAYPDLSVVGLLWRNHPNKAGRPSLRVTWSAGPRFIPRDASLHSDVANRAAIDGDSRGVEPLNAAALRGHFFVDAARLPKRRQIVVFLTPSSSLATGSQTASKTLPLAFGEKSTPNDRQRSNP